ncbi:MAG: hypothetical protein HGA19_14000, partial [Oscillochloris sp.]|nr:hypothetical protein [Oscillochloris sp.]
MRHISMRLLPAFLAVVTMLAALPAARASSACPGGVPAEKSAAGLMPMACGLDPDAPAPPMLTSTVDFLAAPVNTAVGSWAQLVAAADLNNDKVDEAAVSTAAYFDTPNDWKIHLLKQVGAAFSRIQRSPAQKYAEAVVALDANHDGLADLAVAGETGIALIPQVEDAAAPLGDPSVVLDGKVVDALAVGDVTGDLRPDLLAIAPDADTILAWASSPSGLKSYALNLSYLTDGYSALAIGDLNNDGFDDIAALRGSGYASDSVVVFIQDAGSFPASSSFTLSPQTGGFLPHSLAIGDVTNDGLDDLVVTAGGNTPDAYVNVFAQQVSDATTTPPTSSLGLSPVVYAAYHLPDAVQVGDINHDGREDVVLANDAWRTISVYAQSTSAKLDPYATAQVPYSSRYRPNALALGDFDGNGGMDVAVVGRDPGLSVLSNTEGAPTAVITSPVSFASILSGERTVQGTTSAGTIAVEVRVKGYSSWIPATLDGTSWSAKVTLPSTSPSRAWWIEARAINAAGRVQAPPSRVRVRAAGRVRAGLLVEYQFDEREGTTVHDTSAVGTPLDLTLAAEAAVSRVPDGLFVHTPTRIASPEPALKVTRALTESNAFTLEAWVRSASLKQDGTSRIMTLSDDSDHLNVSLVQSRVERGALLGLRLRTTTPPQRSNAAAAEVGLDTYSIPKWYEAFAELPLTTGLTHVMVTRETSGTLTFYINGVAQGSSQAPGDFSSWSDDYALLFANDAKIDRPWLGEYHLSAIYRRALTPDEVLQNYAAGPVGDGSPAQITDAQLVYSFNEGSGTTVGDSSLVLPALPAQIADASAVSWGEGSLSVSAATTIATEGAATKVSRASIATGEISVEAWVTPANTAQNGPAPILSIAKNTCQSDLLFGQGTWGHHRADRYATLLRTTAHHDDLLVSPAGTLKPELTYIVYTRDAFGTSRLFINGEQQASAHADGDLSNWHANYRLALANMLGTRRSWLGSYHSLVVSSRALSATQITARYSAGPESSGSIPPSTSIGPFVQQAVINAGAESTTSRDISLDITVQVPTGQTLDQLIVAEYGFNAEHNLWKLLQRGAPTSNATGGYGWTLKSGAGVRYLQVWATDSAGTTSSYPYQTFINLIPDTITVDHRHTNVYRFALSADETFKVQVDVQHGDPDLYVWGPSGDST